MISYLGSLVQFSPATGRAGRCREISLCVDSTHRVLVTLGLPRRGVSVLSSSTLLRLPAALYGAGPALSAVPVSGTSQKRGFGCVCILCLSGLSGSGSQRLGRPLPGFSAPLPSTAPARSRSGLRKSLDRNRGPVCSVGGCGFPGAEFAPFPSPLPPTSSGDGPALFWSFSVPLFCKPPAVYSGRLIFSLSLAVPQFKLLSHESSL